MAPKPPLQWVVSRFRDGSGVLSAGGQELLVPRGQLPDGAKEGDLLTAEFYFVKDEKKRRENLARAILHEILGK